MNLRGFLRSAGAVSASLAFPESECLLAGDATLEMTHVRGENAHRNPAVFRANVRVQRGGRYGRIVNDRADGLAIVAAEFPAGAKPAIALTSRVATKNYAVDLSVRGKAPAADRAELEHFSRPTKMLRSTGS